MNFLTLSSSSSLFLYFPRRNEHLTLFSHIAPMLGSITTKSTLKLAAGVTVRPSSIHACFIFCPWYGVKLVRLMVLRAFEARFFVHFSLIVVFFLPFEPLPSMQTFILSGPFSVEQFSS
jgi:hypothetical protein